MTPQERLDWFWVVGELPGTIFSDFNDQKAKVPWQPCRRQAKRLQLGSRKRHKAPLVHDGSPAELEPSN